MGVGYLAGWQPSQQASPVDASDHRLEQLTDITRSKSAGSRER